MTFVTSPSAPLTPSSTSWRLADDDVLVATAGGEYAGFVALANDGYDAHGPLGEDLGRHASADLAKSMVEKARTASPARTAPPRAPRSSRLIRPLRARRSGTHGR